MSLRSLRIALCVPLCFPCVASAQAEPRTDPYGDPLPAGTLARLGTARLRHTGLSSFVLLPDGQTVLTAGTDRMLRSWNLATGTPTKVIQLQGKVGPGNLVTLSPDAKTLVARLGQKPLLQFWEVASGKELKTLPAPKEQLSFLTFSHDSKTLAVGSGNVAVSFWDWQAGKERVVQVSVLPNQRFFGGYHGSISPDGRWFVAGAGQSLSILEVATGREAHRLDCSAVATTVSRDNKRLAVSCVEQDANQWKTVIRLFDLSTGKETAHYPCATPGFFRTLAFAPDGKLLACTGPSQSYLLDLTTGRFTRPLLGRPLAAAFTADGKSLVAAAGPRLRVWDVATGNERDARPGDFGNSPVVAVSPDGQRLASADVRAKAVCLWDTTSGRVLRQLSLDAEKGLDVVGLAFAGDGRSLVACHGTHLLRFWDIETGKAQREVQLRDSNNDDFHRVYEMHVARDLKHVSSLSYFQGPAGEGVRLAQWDVDTGKTRYHERLSEDTAQIAWLAGGQTAVVPANERLTLLDVPTGSPRLTFATGAGQGPLVVSRSERLVAARKAPTPGGKDNRGDIVLWETVTGKEVATVKTTGFGNLALASDDRCVVTTEYGVVFVRDAATGDVRLRHPLPESELGSIGRNWVSGLLLSPGGRRAVTIQTEGSALVWDFTAAQRPAQPLVPEAGERELAAWWSDLASEDAGKAWRAIWGLTDAPKLAVGSLASRLKPIAAPDVKKVRRRIADLDSEDFSTRQDAQEELGRIAGLIEPAATEALGGKVSLEMRRRLMQLLEAARNRPPSGEEFRQLRGSRAGADRHDRSAKAARRPGERRGWGMADQGSTRRAQSAGRAHVRLIVVTVSQPRQQKPPR
jgi:WD40 repeat protein